MKEIDLVSRATFAELSHFFPLFHMRFGPSVPPTRIASRRPGAIRDRDGRGRF